MTAKRFGRNAHRKEVKQVKTSTRTHKRCAALAVLLAAFMLFCSLPALSIAENVRISAEKAREEYDRQPS